MNKNIAAIAEGRESKVLQIRFTEPEVNEIRERITNAIIELEVLKDEFDKVKAEHKERTKPIQSRLAEMIDHVRKGYYEKSVEAYKVPNHDTGMMEYLDEDGVVVEERRLYPHERQLRFQEDEPKLKAAQ